MAKKSRRLFFLALAGAIIAIGTFALVRYYQLNSSGRIAYNQVRIGMTKAEVEAIVKMPPSPHGRISGPFERFDLQEVARDGQRHFDVDVEPVKLPDGSILYRGRADGKTVGWVRFWDTPRHCLTVLFGPDGRVVGRVLAEEVGSPNQNWLDRVVSFFKQL